MTNKECEYCKDDMQGKPIENRYAIETIVDDCFLYAYCDCGRHTVVPIHFCPMCGRKLPDYYEDGVKI